MVFRYFVFGMYLWVQFIFFNSIMKQVVHIRTYVQNKASLGRLSGRPALLLAYTAFKARIGSCDDLSSRNGTDLRQVLELFNIIKIFAGTKSIEQAGTPVARQVQVLVAVDGAFQTAVSASTVALFN